ncbi:unnamed protein product [Orchesella dallaii]|uniref:Uncharacterized protein n=1 Tax=Orchesella dallaii TaxID=48710 RepID=A0ABP1PUM8_9HEXA
MAASRRNKEGLKLKPMTEENCALMAGYKYCPKNIRSIGVVEAQQKSIRISCRLINGFPTQCSCPYVGRTKCATQACPNRCIFIACTPTCDPKCQNNPWAHDLFVAGKKTFLKQTEKGFGLFSTTLIQKNTFIGEYTGVVTLDNADLTVEEHSYAFGIAPAGYIIQGFHQGTCMRCVNHSCDPNCEAIQYIHDDEYKIIFSSMNDIPPNTELTIDYGWMHDDIRDAPICKCGSTNCKNIIGSIRPKTHMSKRRRKIQGKRKVARVNNVDPLATEHAPCIPPTFRSTINDTTTEVSEILASTPRPEERPDDYIETHVFRAAEPSYILTQYNGRLGIVRGRVTECYTNNYGFTIYVVDVRSPASMQYHMPRYLCFHYPEDAAYVLQHHIPDEERDMISHYSTPYASREVADGLEYSMPETYSQMVIDGTFPSTRLEKRRFPGPVALGLPPFRLIQCDSDDEPEDETEDECQDEPVHEHRLRSGPKQRIGMTSEQLNAGQEIGRDEGPVKCVTSRVVAVQYIEAYNPLYRRDFKITKNSLHNVTLISRIMESAKENLTWFSISRIRNDIEVDYNDCYSEISSGT